MASSLQPLKLALPFVKPYSGRLLLAFVCLTIASISMLGMPVAIRYVIDYGFSGDNVKSIDLYFMALLGLALVYSVFASFRYYLVMWIGERVVADIRSAVRTTRWPPTRSSAPRREDDDTAGYRMP